MVGNVVAFPIKVTFVTCSAVSFETASLVSVLDVVMMSGMLLRDARADACATTMSDCEETTTASTLPVGNAEAFVAAASAGIVVWLISEFVDASAGVVTDA